MGNASDQRAHASNAPSRPFEQGIDCEQKLELRQPEHAVEKIGRHKDGCSEQDRRAELEPDPTGANAGHRDDSTIGILIADLAQHEGPYHGDRRCVDERREPGRRKN